MKWIKRSFYVIAIGLLLLVGIGVALPGTWTVEREVRISESPAEILEWIDSPEGWAEWVVWPDSGRVRSGPERGSGSEVAWDDPLYGSGRFRIEGVRDDSRVEYSVQVDEGAIEIRGSMVLLPLEADSLGPRTRLVWTESGDFGWNPILGYTALTMDRIQGVQMDSTLQALRRLVESR